MNTLIWDESEGMWRDMWVEASTSSPEDRSLYVTAHRLGTGHYASNYVPLWCGVADGSQVQLQRVVQSLQRSPLLQPGGIATSAEAHFSADEPQQWDWPNGTSFKLLFFLSFLHAACSLNALLFPLPSLYLPTGWAPLQSMVVDGLDRAARQLNMDAAAATSARATANQIRVGWVQGALSGFKASGFLYEKYDVRDPSKGRTGAGGEYVPQVGFGWTNGVVLDFICSMNHDRPLSARR